MVVVEEVVMAVAWIYEGMWDVQFWDVKDE